MQPQHTAHFHNNLNDIIYFEASLFLPTKTRQASQNQKLKIMKPISVIFNLSLALSNYSPVISFTCPKQMLGSQLCDKLTKKSFVRPQATICIYHLRFISPEDDKNRKKSETRKKFRPPDVRWKIVVIISTRPFKFHLNNEEVTLMIHQDDKCRFAGLFFASLPRLPTKTMEKWQINLITLPIKNFMW